MQKVHFYFYSFKNKTQPDWKSAGLFRYGGLCL